MGDLTPKRNPIDKDALKEYNNKKVKSSLINHDIVKQRIEENLKLWENIIDKHHGIKYVPELAKRIRSVRAVRLIINRFSAENNERFGYAIAKHLVNAGVSPTRISIVDLDDCYLHYRGYGEDSLKVKNAVFGKGVDAIVITNVTDNKETHSQENVRHFWRDLLTQAEKRPTLHIVLCFSNNDSRKWFYTEDSEIKERMKKINFLKL